MAEGRLPPGSVVNAGAHHGLWAAFYACTDTQRTVYAIDPDPANVARMQTLYGPRHANLTNLVPSLGGLSSRSGSVQWVKTRAQGINLYPASNASVRRSTLSLKSLDDLYLESERLGFLHLDVEGHEAAVLRGGEQIIARDKPMFVIELCVHCKGGNATELLELAATMGYQSFLVEEVAGARICLPT